MNISHKIAILNDELMRISKENSSHLMPEIYYSTIKEKQKLEAILYAEIPKLKPAVAPEVEEKVARYITSTTYERIQKRNHRMVISWLK
jgi:hypothetical protein